MKAKNYDISSPAPATPITHDIPHPLWAASSAWRYKMEFITNSRLKRTPLCEHFQHTQKCSQIRHWNSRSKKLEFASQQEVQRDLRFQLLQVVWLNLKHEWSILLSGSVIVIKLQEIDSLCNFNFEIQRIRILERNAYELIKYLAPDRDYPPPYPYLYPNLNRAKVNHKWGNIREKCEMLIRIIPPKSGSDYE